MHLLDLIKYSPMLYERRRALHIKGPPGVGKTEVFRNDIKAALEAKYGSEFGYIEKVVPTFDSPDVRGFLIPTKAADGTPSSYFTRSPFLPTKDYIAAHPRGICVLDERDQSDQLMQKALGPVVLDKKFGDESLPEGWWVVSLSNRMQDGAGVGKTLRHLDNRETILELTPAVLPWALWAERRGIHPMLIAFAKFKPGIVFAESVPKESGPFCTPRSFTAAADLLALVAGVDDQGNMNMKIPNDGHIINLISGDISGAAAAELFAFLKTADELPTIEEIEKDPKGCKCPKELSAGFAALQMVIHHAAPTNIDKLWTFAERFPKELQVSACKSLVERGGGILINSPALNKWIMGNRALINASAAK